MSKISTPAHGATHMSPAQAAQRVGVSRWTVMRAINSKELKAFRDNKNQWKITPNALQEWRPSTERTGEEVHTLHTPAINEELIEIREKLAVAVGRAEAAERARDQAEADRDHWRELAMKPWWKRLIG